MNKLSVYAACSVLAAILVHSPATAADRSPYDPGGPVQLPGVVYADSFDNGGEGVSFHDTDVGNNGGFCRSTDVDLDRDELTGHCYLGWTRVGEWVEYSVRAFGATSYSLDVRVASAGDGGTFHIEFNGRDCTGPMTVPNTGGWRRWKTISQSFVSCGGSGVINMRVVMDGIGPSGSVGNIAWIRFTERGTSNAVQAQYWVGLAGEHVTDLTNSAAFLLEPAGGGTRPNFTDSPGGDNYGSRTRGYLHPPTDGDYVFYVGGSNETQLYLSTDDDPAHKHLIASSEAPTNEYRSGLSRPIHLVGGRTYYIETLHKHEYGFDEMTVGWKQPAADFQIPLPGAYLSTLPLLFERLPLL